MVAVDTNVLVRYLTRDDPKQAARAASLVESQEAWIAKTVLLETAWVLESLYGYGEVTIAGALRKLAGLESVRLEDPLAVAKALDWSSAGLDLADALHVASSGAAERFATIDEKLARRASRQAGLQIMRL